MLGNPIFPCATSTKVKLFTKPGIEPLTYIYWIRLRELNQRPRLHMINIRQGGNTRLNEKGP